MKKSYLIMLFVFCCICAKAQDPVILLSNLQYPTGLWVKGDNVFLTETRGRSTIYGGTICLDRYRISSGQKTVMVNNPENSDGVVAASDGKIYLTSYQNGSPGNLGKVSVVDTTTLVETHLLDIQIASEDMCIDDSDNIRIIGYNTGFTAKSIYLLPAANYLNDSVLKTGLGLVWCIAQKNDTTYYSNQTGIYYFGNDGVVHNLMNKSLHSISFSSDHLFYVENLTGTIGRVNLQTMFDQTLVTGLCAQNVRYDAAADALYFVECGSDTFTNGTLRVIYNANKAVQLSYNTGSICGTDSAQICATAGYVSYLWSNGDTSRCIDVKNAGNYNVTVTDSTNHTDSSGYVTITAYPVPSSVSIVANGDTLMANNAVICQWYLNDSAINGATSNTYIAAQTGNYTVAVTDSNGCVAVSGPFAILGIRNLTEDDGVHIYPNPTNGKFTIEMNGRRGAKIPLEIYNVMGEKVYETTISWPSSAIQLNAPDGVYFLHMITEQGMASRKMVITH